MASEQFTGDAHSLAGRVRIGSTEGLGCFFLSPQLARFTCNNPDLSIDLLPVVRLQCDSRKPEQRKLHRYSTTVMVSAALTNQTKIVLAENIMFDQASRSTGIANNASRCAGERISRRGMPLPPIAVPPWSPCERALTGVKQSPDARRKGVRHRQPFFSLSKPS
jgi:hypothetical protein